MNLSENLKKIRKDNNLSQEQLAEQLGVSRQSVSKWESGQAYPEMDKMLQLCQLFNLNIDELLNQDLKEVNNEKQSKNNINKFIDDFLDYVTKTVDMFSGMKFKDKFKCLFEQGILISIIFIVLLIIGLIGSNIFSNLISFMPDKIYYIIHSLFESLYYLIALVFGIILVLHIFKVRYLDYYVIVKEEKPLKEDKKEVIQDDKKVVIEPKKETIVIRDPKHSGYKFISGLLRILLFSFKVLIGSIGITFCLSLIGLVILLALAFTISQTGMFFIGLLLCLISCIVVNIIVLVFIYNFIVSRKNKTNKLAISFLLSLLVLGVGIGFMFIGISKFEIVDSTNEEYYFNSTKTFEMDDDLFFYSYTGNIEYIESDNKNIEVVFKSSSFYDLEFTKVENGYYISNYFVGLNKFEVINTILKDFNDKKIVDYYDNKIYIYTTKENIEILENNLLDYWDFVNERNYQDVINDYERQINLLNDRINELENSCNIDC